VKKPKRKLARSGKLAKPKARRGRFRSEDEAGFAHDDSAFDEKMLRGRENEAALSADASMAELRGDVREGQVVAVRGPLAVVAPPDGDHLVECILRKSTRVPHPQATALVVGDLVSYLAGAAEPHTLTEVKPRRSRLARTRDEEEQVTAANVDLAVIIASAVQPRFKPRLVDRYLIAAREGGLDSVLVVHKADLLPESEAAQLLEPYENLPMEAVATSVKSGLGMERLTEILRGKTSVFAGQSGVGKSSIINALIPDLDAKTGEIQSHTGKGRHTTTASTLYRFPFGGSVVDTPGVRSFSLGEPSEEALQEFFPEISAAAAQCKFSNCSHQGDAGCALPQAIRSGAVHPDRLESYLVLVHPAGVR
jgi:ribosome biogenesis GTPase